MPSTLNQVTPDDFKAPTGKFRIMREEMSDGQLSIVADYHFREFALIGLEACRLAHPTDNFTFCDEIGQTIL